MGKASYIEVRGVKLKVYDSGGEREYSSPLTLVFLHGFPGQMSNWKYQVPYFREKYRVIVYDQRGFGESDKPREVSFEDYVEDLDSLLGAIGVDSGDTVVIGHSFGAMVAQLYARDHSVKGVVLIGSLIKMRIDFLDYIIWYLPSLIWKPLFFSRNPLTERIYSKLYFSPSTPKKVFEEFAEDNVDYLKRLPPHSYRYSKYFKGYNAEPWLGRIRVPTLVIVGEDDKATPPEENKKISELIPNSRLIVVKNAGHMVIYEKPREVNKAIEDFIKEI